MKKMHHVAVIGTGPAGLMAATTISKEGSKVTVFEKKRGPGRKLLIAGSSGLNVTYDAPLTQFKKYYGGCELIERSLDSFTPDSWIKFINEKLNLETFKGTSRRFFLKDMKASKLLRAWINLLTKMSVEFVYSTEVIGFNSTELKFNDGKSRKFDAVVFALGGGSYEPQEKPLKWVELFKSKDIAFEDFKPSNVGYEVDFPKGFLPECEGKPLKNVILKTRKGEKAGELMFTRYGVEGTPVYTLGCVGLASIDLLPTMNVEEIVEISMKLKENLSPIRRLAKSLHLDSVKQSVMFYFSNDEEKKDLILLITRMKKIEINLITARPIDEAISTNGGVKLHELDQSLMLKKIPGVFLCGEMLDWDTVTGGFLIQACVSTGLSCGTGVNKYLDTLISKL